MTQDEAPLRNGPVVPAVARENIRSVRAIEQEFRRRQRLAGVLSDWVAAFAGSVAFFLINAIWFAGWILVNSGMLPRIRPFDPYPFTFLTLVVSLEAIFLSIFVLASENRAAQQAERRAQLDLQVNLLAEQESTAALQMLRALCDHLGVKHGTQPGEEELAKTTAPESLMREMEAEEHGEPTLTPR
jgi:uncharacterized membrane protein